MKKRPYGVADMFADRLPDIPDPYTPVTEPHLDWETGPVIRGRRSVLRRGCDCLYCRRQHP